MAMTSAVAVGANDSQALAHPIAAVMDVGGLLLGLALLVSWAFIVLLRRTMKSQQQEALS
jgi:hypothetical protein